MEDGSISGQGLRIGFDEGSVLSSSSVASLDDRSITSRPKKVFAFEEDAQRKQSEECDAMLERYRKGHHIFVDSAKLQREDITLEQKMYLKAAQVIETDKQMLEYDEEKHGVVKEIKQSEEHVADVKAREVYIDTNKDAIAYHNTYWAEKKKVKEILREIADNNMDISDITAEAEAEKLNHPFDWQLQLNNKIFALDKENARLKDELEISRSKVSLISPPLSPLQNIDMK